jgi:uncharacterized protein DUF4286
MIIYEVTAVVEARLAETYERYMREHHIPDVIVLSREVWTVMQRWDG